jgi:vancomycin resistance protein YoaR
MRTYHVIPLVLLAAAGLVAATWRLSHTGGEAPLASYGTSLHGRTPAQRANALRAAAAISGVVIAPGGRFSFNGRVGSLSRDRGYLKAPVSFDGELVPSFGGGVCQTSTTLYNAALLSGMKLIERHRHVWPPHYASHGDDAAVAYPTYDLAFANPLDCPVRIQCDEQGDRLVCALHASRRPAETYELQHKLRAVEPMPTVREGSGHATRRLVKGQAGFSVTTYRLTRRDGQIIAREIIAEDSYQPLPEVIETTTDPGDISS